MNRVSLKIKSFPSKLKTLIEEVANRHQAQYIAAWVREVRYGKARSKKNKDSQC